MFSVIFYLDFQEYIWIKKIEIKYYTCMLLYLLKVLKQRGHENCVGPIRIWAGVGIQYWPLLILLGGHSEATVTTFSSSSSFSETKSDEVIVGSPRCKATVTASWTSSRELDDILSCSFSFMFIISMELKEDSRRRSSCFVGFRLSKGRASLGGDGDEKDMLFWWW